MFILTLALQPAVPARAPIRRLVASAVQQAAAASLLANHCLFSAQPRCRAATECYCSAAANHGQYLNCHRRSNKRLQPDIAPRQTQLVGH